LLPNFIWPWKPFVIENFGETLVNFLDIELKTRPQVFKDVGDGNNNNNNNNKC
jgi:hypothetical protein